MVLLWVGMIVKPLFQIEIIDSLSKKLNVVNWGIFIFIKIIYKIKQNEITKSNEKQMGSMERRCNIG